MYTGTMKARMRTEDELAPPYVQVEGYFADVPLKGDAFKFRFELPSEQKGKVRAYELTFNVYHVEQIPGGFRFYAKDAIGDVLIGATLPDGAAAYPLGAYR